MSAKRFMFCFCVLGTLSASFVNAQKPGGHDARSSKKPDRQTSSGAASISRAPAVETHTARSCNDLSRKYPLNSQAAARQESLIQRWVKIQSGFATLSVELGQEVDPLRIKDSMARRFINKSEWESEIKKSSSKADPRKPYGADTWNNWAKTALNVVQPQSKSLGSPDLSTLLSWNEGALLGLLPDHIKIGALKETPNYGKNTKKRDALSASEIESLESLGLKFSPLVCLESLPQALPPASAQQSCQDILDDAKKQSRIKNEKQADWIQIQNELGGKNIDRRTLLKRWYWYACWPKASYPRSKSEKACGMFAYPEPEVAARGLRALLKEAQLFESCAKNGGVDRFSYVADMQRRMVALHPFNKGNGRVSRWMMDALSTRQGLPHLLVPDMNRDLSTPRVQHESLVNQETNLNLDRLEACLQQYQQNGYAKTQDTLCGEWRN